MIDSDEVQVMYRDYGKFHEATDAAWNHEPDWKVLWERRGKNLKTLAAENARIQAERDMLAQLAARLAHELIALKYPPQPTDDHPAARAIAVHQSQGVR